MYERPQRFNHRTASDPLPWVVPSQRRRTLKTNTVSQGAILAGQLAIQVATDEEPG